MPKRKIEIETQRLLLRRWQKEDLDLFIQMNQDDEVMRYFPSKRTAAQTKEFYEKIIGEFSEYGYGLYAAEEKHSGEFIGFIGFHHAHMDVSFCPCLEIGWRLDKRYWGKGYATEGAKACLKHGFEKLDFDKIYSFTAILNKPSQRVMQKIRMKFEQYFEHPEIAESHPLRPHVCYSIDRNEYNIRYKERG